MSRPAADKPTAREPRGVIAIVTAPNGEVIAAATDFSRDGYGGFKLWEAQKMRARDWAIRKAVVDYTGPALAAMLTDHLYEQLGRALVAKGEHRITIRVVGWPDDVKELAEETER